jgi:hypothetical protein
MNFLHTEYDSEPDDSLEKSMSLVASAISDPSRVSVTSRQNTIQHVWSVKK